MESPSRADIWRCLIGEGVSSATATAICSDDDVTLARAFAAVSSPEAPAAGAPVSVLLEDSLTGPIAPTLNRLERIDRHHRRAVLAHHVAGLPPDRLLAGARVTATDLRAGETALALGSRLPPPEAARELLLPLLDLPAPTDLDPVSRRTPAIALVLAAAVVAAGFVIAALTGTRPAGLDQPETAAATATAAPTSSPATRIEPTTTNRYTEPDREVEVVVTESNTIVRQEPWTRRVIWESRPFRGTVEIVSVDPNTVTIDYSGRRLLVSLADGTFLPP